METTEDWMIEQHLCRCCHSEGKYKSLISTDNLMEDELLYLDALRFCLDIELCLVEGPLAYAACTICEACVARLQEVCSFRRQVLSCEGRFQTLYSQNRIKVTSSKLVVKEELSEPDDSYFEDNHNMHFISIDIKEEKPKENRQKSESPCVPTKRDHSLTASTDDRDIQRKATKKKEFRVSDSDYKRVQNKFKCTRCSNILSSLNSLRVHIRTRHLAENKYNCTLCKTSFRTKMPFVNHKLDAHNIDDRFKCNACDKMFYSKPELNKHFKRFHKLEDKYKYPPKQTRVSTKPRRSLPAPADERDTQRLETRKVTEGTVYRLLASDYERTGDKVTCTRCSKTLNSMDTLRRHIKSSHLGVNKYKCTLCNKSFRTMPPFVNHKLDEHNIDDRFKCNACDKMFNTKRQLDAHKNCFHMLGEKYKCPQCDFESYSVKTLTRHKIKHKTVKDYHCKYCKKSFLRKTTLQFHERIHTGDRRKVCAECGQAFVQKASLNYHMMKYHPAVKY